MQIKSVIVSAKDSLPTSLLHMSPSVTPLKSQSANQNWKSKKELVLPDFVLYRPVWPLSSLPSSIAQEVWFMAHWNL